MHAFNMEFVVNAFQTHTFKVLVANEDELEHAVNMEFVLNAFQTHTFKVLVANEDELGVE